MKTLFGLAAALTLSLPAAALAQSPIYGSLGYANHHVTDADAGAVQARLGARLSPYFGAEVELSKGVKSGDGQVSGIPLEVEVEHQAAIYGVGFLPITPRADLFVRAGYGETKLNFTAAGGSATDRNTSWNFGAGGQYFLDDKNGVRLDYTHHDFMKSEDTADVWVVAYTRKF
ncbi:MAG: porin family protein [Phenylobacterium sp.]|uniref:porin family protein n=1 Tax=Phenylobacterium sp. TaxID=1871053 RepID=UPI00271D00A1|nr:porin family protein [Phenylobacterium sp.]MDO8911390.1 porin family protein [Phenylobacterium sp.]MDP3099093.1 porin family protein [Phenylobacterium sp.]